MESKDYTALIVNAQLATYVLKDWQLVPENGKTICLLGTRDVLEGEIQTTTIREVKKLSDNSWTIGTRSGTIYIINSADRHKSMWQLALYCKRPNKYAALRSIGIVP
jgi:ribosomal protein L36